MTNPDFRDFFPPISLEIGWDCPLVWVYVTVIEPIGYTVLAVTLSHAIFDGFSLTRFLHEWSLHCCSSLQVNSFADRSLYCRVPRPDLLTEDALLHRFPLSSRQASKNESSAVRLQRIYADLLRSHQRKTFRVTGSTLARWKYKVNEILKKEGAWVSSSELLFAMVTCGSATSRSDHGSNNDFIEMWWRLVIDLRGRTELFPDNNYIGNAFARPLVKAKVRAFRSDTADLLDYLLEHCRMAHRTVRSLIQNCERLEDYYCAAELASQQPALAACVADSGYADVCENMGFHFNTWKSFESCFNLGMGTEVNPCYMNTSPLYGDSLTPRVISILPTQPDSTVELTVHLTRREVCQNRSHYSVDDRRQVLNGPFKSEGGPFKAIAVRFFVRQRRGRGYRQGILCRRHFSNNWGIDRLIASYR